MTERGIEAARQISQRLQPYCTVLLKLFVGADGHKRVLQIGSGTLVRAGLTHGILTAFHCTVPLNGDYLLGLSGGPEGKAHNFTLERHMIKIVPIAKPFDDERGPDLAFVAIADWSKVEALRASKSFYDLTGDKDAVLNDSTPPDKTLWYICGVPNERLEDVPPEAGFERTFQFQHLCGAGGVDRAFDRDGFDYAEMDITPAPDDPPPSSFEGMSGGGLWQVPVAPANELPFSAVNHFLAGVIYYQGVSESGVRFVRSHFRKSVYIHALSAILQTKSPAT
jgi:hypothetical protein